MSEQQDAPEGSTDPDVKKYFNNKQYSTMIIGAYTPKKEERDLTDLLSDSSNKHLRHDALTVLKNNKGGNALMEAVKGAKNEEKRQLLLSACWESGIDFSDHLVFFNEIAVQDSFLNCIEAITVIENMDPLPAQSNIIIALEALGKGLLDRLQPEKEGLLESLKVIYNDMLIKLG